MEDEDFTVFSQKWRGGGILGLQEERARSGPQPGLHSVNSEYLNSQTPHKSSAGKCVQCVPPRLSGAVVLKRACTGASSQNSRVIKKGVDVIEEVMERW